MANLPVKVKGKVVEKQQTLSGALLAGVLSSNTFAAYKHDLEEFQEWLQGQGLRMEEVSKDHLLAFRAELIERYQPATVNRKLVTLRLLCREAAERGVLRSDPSARLKGLRQNGDFAATLALSQEQARGLLAAINRKDLPGKRDYALLSLLLRTGLRRAEATALEEGDIQQTQGFVCLRVQGKGGKERRVKLPDDVQKHLADWTGAAGIIGGALFRQLRKHGRGKAMVWQVGDAALTPMAVWKIFKRRLEAAGIEGRFSPHSLRATFITLALGAGAGLHRVQYCAGHADPRTTERYDRGRENLENSATDYVRL